MQQSDTFIIAREGWKFVGGAAAVFVLFVLFDCDLLQFIAFVAGIFLAYLYRNPERITPYYQEQSVVSVADGRIRSIETVDSCPWLEGPCYKVEIVSGVLDAALLRMPFEGIVKNLDLRRGSRLSSLKPLALRLNERAQLCFESRDGNRCAVEHLLGQTIDAISLHASHDQRFSQGGRYGLMLQGVHTLYLPVESRVAVKVGDEVRAGESLIGYFS